MAASAATAAQLRLMADLKAIKASAGRLGQRLHCRCRPSAAQGSEACTGHAVMVMQPGI